SKQRSRASQDQLVADVPEPPDERQVVSEANLLEQHGAARLDLRAAANLGHRDHCFNTLASSMATPSVSIRTSVSWRWCSQFVCSRRSEDPSSASSARTTSRSRKPLAARPPAAPARQRAARAQTSRSAGAVEQRLES